MWPAIGLGVAGGIGGYFAAREQRKAQEQQMAMTQQRLNQAMAMTGAGGQSLGATGQGGGFMGGMGGRQMGIGMQNQPGITALFPTFQNAMAPTFNVLGQQAGLAGQQAAQSLQANYGRLGLGSTGLGASMGAGVQAGAAFQANALRARMMQDLFGEAINTQMGRASLLAGMPIPQAPMSSPWLGAMQGAGSGMQLGGQYQAQQDWLKLQGG